MANILVACEYSGRVRDAFIAIGHNAVSCDLLDSDTPGPHYKGDVFDIINDGWDMMIAHPPCTYLTCSAEWAYKEKQNFNIKPETLIGWERQKARIEAIMFIYRLWESPIKYKCIENPVGIINKRIPYMPKPQFIQPYWFGEDASKKTGLWLDGLPHLTPTLSFPPRIVGGKKRWSNQSDNGQNMLPPSIDRWKLRSTTYKGIAKAMAEQWSII